MTEDEYLARQEAIYRGRELVDDWEELRAMGPEASRYC
jgi:hypothetical protein